MVLGWHRVDNADTKMAVAPAVFSRQLQILDQHRHEIPVVPLDEAATDLAAGLRGARRIVLTFDDAWADNHAHALGPLAARRLPAILYVPSRLLGRRGYMTRSQLLEMNSAGVDIGAHSRTHPDLRACDDAGLESEVRGSKDDLEDLLGKPVSSFAYPTGLLDQRVIGAVAAAGFTSAVTTRPAWWRPETSALQIPRGFMEEFSDGTCLAATRGGLVILAALDAAKQAGWPRGRGS
jgi:peptidoglycan/xylan/chitin deacetylase (PgdA/CDA1 family)